MRARRLRRLVFRVGAALAAITAAQTARADDVPACDGCAQQPPACVRELRVTPGVEYGFPADLRGGRGRLSVFRALLGVDASVPVSDRLQLQLAFTAEDAAYHLSDPDAVVPGSGRLLDEGRLARIETMAKLDLPRGWGLAAGPIFQSAGVPGARFEKTFTWGGQG